MRKLIATVAMVLLAGPASAMPTLQVDGDGQLIGATGVDAGGTLYDVLFVDGSCVDLFGGCDETSDFIFPTSGSGSLASQVLLDQVFVDGPLGAFDSMPDATIGCEDLQTCFVLTPTEITIPPNTFTADRTENGDINDDTFTGLFNLDSSLDPRFVYAVWSLSDGNLLSNADFDFDVAGWTPETNNEQATWDADDFEGSPQSGSLLLTFPGALGSRRVSACVSLGAARDYVVSGWMRIPADVEQGAISTFGFTSADCSSGPQGFSGGTSLFPVTNVWSFQEAQLTVPADTMSLQIDLGASDPTAGTYTVRFDSVFLPEPAAGLSWIAALASLAFLSRRFASERSRRLPGDG